TEGFFVGRKPDGARDKAIERIRLVAASAHQRIENEPHSGGTVALQDIGIQRIKGGEILVSGGGTDLKHDLAPLRGTWIHVRKMAEGGRLGEIAEDREAVGLGLLRGRLGAG